MQFRVSGIVPAMATPLEGEDLAVNYAVLDSLCDFLVERGVAGLFILGTTGEGALLSMEERKSVAERVVRHAGSRVTVIVNCGDITTRGTIELAEHAAVLGADAISVVFPYYYQVSEEDAMEHFATVARRVPEMPVYAYYYRRTLEAEKTLRLREMAPNVVGIKDGVGDYGLVLGHVVLMGDSFSILEGSEALAFGALTLGIDGLISGVATAFPELFVKLYGLVKNGRYQEALVEQARIFKLTKVIYGKNPWARIKKSLELRGVAVGRARPPVGACTPAETDQLTRALRELDLL